MPLMPLETCCTWCDTKLVAEELESPHKIDDETACDKCYDHWLSDNSFECGKCGDWFDYSEHSDAFVILNESCRNKDELLRTGPVRYTDWLLLGQAAWLCKDCKRKSMEQDDPREVLIVRALD